MPTELAKNHILAQAHLREIVAAAVTLTWDSLPDYDDGLSVEQFIAGAVPIVLAGQRQSVALTEAYLARMLRRPVFGLSSADLSGASVRAGAPPQEVYRRPFVTVWTALSKGVPWDQAVSSGRARVGELAQSDIQLSSRAAFQATQDEDDGIYGYRRVADSGACSFCQAVNGAYLKSADASPLHPHCGCSLEPLTRPHPKARYLPSGESVVRDDYAIHQHGEMGAFIGDPAHEFQTL